MSLSEERLDEIRERSADAMQAYNTGTVGTPPNIDGLTLSEALDYIGESAEDVPDLLEHVDHLTAELATAHTAWDEWKTSSRAGHAHASDMADEVARLREGIEALALEAEHAIDAKNPLSSLGRVLLMWQPDALRALLATPTEGQDHDRR